jgi:hypothetical protein
MEHILWEVVTSDKPVDIDATASRLTELLWSGLRAPAAELAALRAMRSELGAVLQRAGAR